MNKVFTVQGLSSNSQIPLKQDADANVNRTTTTTGSTKEKWEAETEKLLDHCQSTGLHQAVTNTERDSETKVGNKIFPTLRLYSNPYMCLYSYREMHAYMHT